MKKFTTRQKKSEKTSKKKSKNKWNKQATQNSMKKFTTAPGGDRHGGSEVELQEPMKMLTWSSGERVMTITIPVFEWENKTAVVGRFKQKLRTTILKFERMRDYEEVINGVKARTKRGL